MPNWCSNKLAVSGKDTKKFIETLVEGQYLLFNTLVPMPEELLNGEGWYNWRLENWGTKWDLDKSNSFAVDHAGSLHFHFDTAWSPPEKWALKVSEKFPKLTLSLFFSEMGMCYYGSMKFRNGECVEENMNEDLFTEEEDEDEFPVPTDEYQNFLDEHGLGMGG